MSQDRVRLTVPAKSEYARTVRMTAASLASRMGMSYDDLEDVRMAAEEAFVYAVDTVADNAELDFTFTVSDDAIAIVVGLGADLDLSGEDAERRASLTTFILESVCDSFELASDASGRPSLRVVKSSGTADAV